MPRTRARPPHQSSRLPYGEVTGIGERKRMRRVLEVRITRWELKLAYVIGVIAVGWAFAALSRVGGLPEPTLLLVVTLIDVVGLLLGARVFRGRGEAIEPPRVWWRMTARPKLSRNLGVVFVVAAALTLAGMVFTLLGMSAHASPPAETVATGILGVLEYGAFAFLYLNSAARLTRLGVAAQSPRFRAPKRLPT